MIPVDTIYLSGTIVCCECGIRFAFDRNVHASRRADGHNFWCPNGHAQQYGETDADRLRRELDAANERVTKARAQTERERERTEHERRRHAATKGQLTRVRKRVGAGVCPCCNRTFQQLARHMAAQHPGFRSEPT